MSATPVRQHRYPHGVAYFGALLALGLAMAGGCVYLMIIAVEKDLPRTLVVAGPPCWPGLAAAACTTELGSTIRRGPYHYPQSETLWFGVRPLCFASL